ncbi:MAG: eukaryotic-like serine/threonine-protein kinase [Chthoniobacter sp.]|jgi:predicted Ser/Thr protein kinase|nr:eukaryotic-like serine/threonine-protein kinase [Chthoniobacter sp.]
MSESDVTQDMPADTPIPAPPPIAKARGRIGTSFGGYEVEGELGRGGMGVVYRARQATLNRQVALKMLTGHFGDDELKRFLAEAQTAAALHHSNIVHIYEVGEIDGAPFFSMEFIEGGTLADRLRKGRSTLRETAELLAVVARALHFAHQRGVVHRDMKPGNILLDADGVPKVADFGIAKNLGDGSDLTRSGAVIGTPMYMAPEQAKGTSREVGPAADVYALGAILYEMLTGRPPFLPEESDTALTLRVLTEETPSPARHRPEIPRELEVICMKCLQKDPRDRYLSAAAFAEDLRRFLDDEPILARPRPRFVRALKWTQRHPWQFVLCAGLLALLAAGGQRVWRWQFYERPHVEYAANVDYVRGGFEPVVRLTKEQMGHRAVNLQLTRRGRWGPVTQVDVLNARGHPAELRRVLNDEAIPIYVESLAGAHPYEEKVPETTRVEFLYEGQMAREATGRDRTGSVNWRILYDREIASAGVAGVARARFVNLRGIDAAGRNGAAHLEFERDPAGHDVKVNFFNTAGRPAPNGEGVFGYQLERDPTGRIVRLVNLGRDGRPAPNRAGLISCALTWSPGGQVTRAQILDETGQPALWNGVAALATEYDAAGNAIRVTRLGADGQRAHREGADWAVQEIARNERGEVVQRKYYKNAADGALELLSQRTMAYDEFGHPAAIRFAGATQWRTALQHDPSGNITEERYLDGEGHLVASEKGYAIKRLTYTFGPQGLRRVDTYFDAAGAKTYSTGGYHRLIDEFDVTGMLRRQTTEDHERSGFYRQVGELEWDQQGRRQRSTTRFEDEQGRLATNAGLAYNEEEEEYDENGREIATWQAGWSVESFGAPVWRKDTEWYSTGVMRRRVWQAYDANRQPLSTISNDDPARTEEEFSALGKLERKLETGFAEARLGFQSRELRIAGGQVQSVVHRHADGSALNEVRVLIKSVFADAQAKAAELRPGDQFLTANGTPVRSAYEWMLGSNFTGGWIEVLREGQRLRIDGFEAGKLGVLLEDRGP